jgi:hypothetical protein
MSSNLTMTLPIGIICVSDRRLTGLGSGAIKTNRSTKMTVFGCADAHGVIVYNGIGMDDAGKTPSDWLMELAEKKLFDLPLAAVLEGVSADLETRLRTLRARHGPRRARHTFIFGVWHQGATAVHGISNYERVDDDVEAAEGSENVFQSVSSRHGIITTGARPAPVDLKAIRESLKAGPLNRVIALCVKAVRRVALGRGKARGTVGAACQWASVGPERSHVRYGLDVVGGAIAQEPPNLVNIAAEMFLGGSQSVRIGGPGMLISHAYAGGSEAANVARYDSAKKVPVFSERQCGICGTPRPASHRFCEVCLYEKHHVQGKKRRRPEVTLPRKFSYET